MVALARVRREGRAAGGGARRRRGRAAGPALPVGDGGGRRRESTGGGEGLVGAAPQIEDGELLAVGAAAQEAGELDHEPRIHF